MRSLSARLSSNSAAAVSKSPASLADCAGEVQPAGADAERVRRAGELRGARGVAVFERDAAETELCEQERFSVLELLSQGERFFVARSRGFWITGPVRE